MKNIIFLLLLLPIFCIAQITTKQDSTGKRVIITTVQELPDGTKTIVESSVLDSNTVRERLFNVLMDTYNSAAKLEVELRRLNVQASQLTTQFAKFDTTNFSRKVNTMYGASLMGDYSYKQKTITTDAVISVNPTNKTILRIETGATKGTIRMLSPYYIEVRRYFKNDAGTTIDVFMVSDGKNWTTEINGKRIVLRKK